MAKPEERLEARALRLQGLSVNAIARQIKVSTSSVSTWVHDIELSPDQYMALSKNAHKNLVGARRGNSDKWFKVRLENQELGRARALSGDLSFVCGCMLYWAEGSKRARGVGFVNSDRQMLIVFLEFLDQCFNIHPQDVCWSISAYDDQHTLDEIIYYWRSGLGLSPAMMRKPLVNHRPISSQNKRRVSYYGVCRLMVHDIRILHQIFGGIQAVGKFRNEEWLNQGLMTLPNGNGASLQNS